MTGAAQPPIFPPGYPRGPRLRPLYHGAMWDVRPGKRGEPSAEWRRNATRDPLIFAMRYLSPYLSDETTGIISFSDMHLAFYDRMLRWWEPGPDRSLWASHRSAAKTILSFLVAPLYRAAHFPDDYCLMLSDTGDQAKDHLATLKGVIRDGGDLLVDFPHLRPGHPWTVADARTVGGARFKAAGMEKSILGARDRHVRPRYVAIDDPEPGPADWTPASKAKTLGRLLNDVLPATSPNAAVVVTGTPVAQGSLMHDAVNAVRGRPGALVDGGEWVRASGFDPYWYPVILDAGTPTERSAWEVRHPIATVRQGWTPPEFALQMMCDPDDPAAAKWWTAGPYPQGTFRYDKAFGGFNLWRILSIDPAVTSKRATSDETAIVVLSVTGSTPASMRVCVDRAVAGHWSPDEIAEQVWELQQEFADTVRVWLVDVVNGGDHVLATLPPPPRGVKVEPYRTNVDSKSARAESLFDDYERGAVKHRGRFPKMEAEMVAWRWGQTKSPNLIDACGAAVRRALYGDPTRAPARRGLMTATEGGR